MPQIDFTREELRQLQNLCDATEGRLPPAFWSAYDKIQRALNAPSALLAGIGRPVGPPNRDVVEGEQPGGR